jgi:hypothetical protein
MKRYTLCLGQQIGYVHPAPERTAKRAQGAATQFKDDVFQIWPSRNSMARSIRMQQQREPRFDDWQPLVKLSDGEGY